VQDCKLQQDRAGVHFVFVTGIDLPAKIFFMANGYVVKMLLSRFSDTTKVAADTSFDQSYKSMIFEKSCFYRIFPDC
jgi:hypothetical protein